MRRNGALGRSADVQSGIASTFALSRRLVHTAGAAAAVGRGSGAAFPIAFDVTRSSSCRPQKDRSCGSATTKGMATGSPGS